MDTHHLQVNLNINPLTDAFDMEERRTGQFRQTKVSFDLLSPGILDFCEKHHLIMVWAECFHTPPGRETPIHIDEHGGDYTKLNYIYGGRGSTMNWYSVKDFAKNKEPSLTVINTKYLAYEPNEVTLIEAAPLLDGSSYVIQAGTPHNVTNADEDRFCISLIFKDADRKRFTMAGAKELFADYLV